MKTKLTAVAVLATALIAAPMSQANASPWHHGGRGGGGLFFGLLAAGAAVTGAAVALATAPIRVVADASVAPPPPVNYVYAQPAYYPQQRVVYAQPYAYPTYVYAQ